MGGGRPYNFSSPLAETVALQERMTEVLVPTLEKLSDEEPAVYLNEVRLLPLIYKLIHTDTYCDRPTPSNPIGKAPFTAPITHNSHL